MGITYESFTIPPNTTVSNPARLDFFLGGREISRIGLSFPNGCYNAVGVRLSDINHIVAPINGGWIRGNNQVIEWPDSHIVNGPPWRVSLEGYSDADDWPHTIGVYIITQ